MRHIIPYLVLLFSSTYQNVLLFYQANQNVINKMNGLLNWLPILLIYKMV